MFRKIGKLTEEQKKLIEEGFKRLPSTIYKYNSVPEEEVYNTFVNALVKAAVAYSKKQPETTFLHFMSGYIRGYMQNYIRMYNNSLEETNGEIISIEELEEINFGEFKIIGELGEL